LRCEAGWLTFRKFCFLIIRNKEPLVNYAGAVVNEPRTDPINSDKSRVSAKIAEGGRFDRVPPPHVGGYGSSSAVAICLGGTGDVPVGLHGKGNVGAKPKGEVVADILVAIRERKP
jgi:threonyl-tRNA synthetase